MSHHQLTPREIEIRTIKSAIHRLATRLHTLETANQPKAARRRLAPLEHGTEQMYQRHHHFRDTAKDGRRVTCEPCLKAHAEHQRIQYAIRRAHNETEAS